MRPKNWILRHQREQGQTLWSAMLAARKIENPGAFFARASIEDLINPFEFQDMQKAVCRLESAIQKGERIVVYGDYDVDGTSGSAVLIHTLKELGGNVSYRIPHRRDEGYGLHAHHVTELAEQNVKVLITVDLGISCAKEVTLAQEKGIDVILTDHHAIPKNLPQAFATLHPKVDGKVSFKDWSGSGVAFKLASALLKEFGKTAAIENLTDLASLGTVADCVPLVGENRILVKLGLQQLKKSRWEGVKALLQQAGWRTKSRMQEEWGTDLIGFQIGPRINAAGRMDSPYWALQTLLANTPEEAAKKSAVLEDLNRQRQNLMSQIQEDVELKMTRSDREEAPVLILSGEGWSSGLVGLIAGRLQEKYGKPVFLMEDQGATLTGSVRAIPGWSAIEALQAAATSLEKFGGHEMAGGFHLKKENLADFTEKVHHFAQQKIEKNGGKRHEFNLEVDTELRPEDVSIEALSKLSVFAPFGVGNPTPLFLLEAVECLENRAVGASGKHFKSKWKWRDLEVETIAFNAGDKKEKLEDADHLVVSPEISEWQGRKRINFQIKAWG